MKSEKAIYKEFIKAKEDWVKSRKEQPYNNSVSYMKLGIASALEWVLWSPRKPKKVKNT